MRSAFQRLLSRLRSKVFSRRTRPRILLLADCRDWAYDRAARAIARHLKDEFEFRIAYVRENPKLDRWPFDLIYVFFWGETYHQKYISDRRRVIKEISSHRWGLEEAYGRLSPRQTVQRYLADAGTLTATSRRLQHVFAPYREVFWTPNGFEPSQFFFRNERRGPLRIGWAGNENDPCKGLKDILVPATGKDFEFAVAGGKLTSRAMLEFYNSIDVLCVASVAEGEPLTLLEGLACGCFPVAVDVGIVPELIRHRENGLIVSRNIAAFRAAFQWCRRNLQHVREKGRANSADMLKTRTWNQISLYWRLPLRSAMQKLQIPQEERRSSAVKVTPSTSGAPARNPPAKHVALFSAAVNGDNSGDALITDAVRRMLAPNSFSVFPLLRSLTNLELDQVNACDVGIVCGTNLYQHVFACALTADTLARLKVPLLPLGVGTSAPIGQLPRMDAGGVAAVRLLHERCAVGSVRDPLSLEFVRGLGIKNVELTGCPVLFHALTRPVFHPNGDDRLFVSVRARLLHVEESWGVKARRTLELLCARCKPTLVLQSPYDLEIGLDLARRFNVDYVHDGAYGHELLVRAARRAARVAGFRLHFGMISLSYGKPATFIATDTRTSEFCRMMGLPYHDIHTYHDEAFIKDLESGFPAKDEFGAAWQHLFSAMSTVLSQNGLAHVLGKPCSNTTA